MRRTSGNDGAEDDVVLATVPAEQQPPRALSQRADSQLVLPRERSQCAGCFRAQLDLLLRVIAERLIGMTVRHQSRWSRESAKGLAPERLGFRQIPLLQP